jgi:hypothetical protein
MKDFIKGTLRKRKNSSNIYSGTGGKNKAIYIFQPN